MSDLIQKAEAHAARLENWKGKDGESAKIIRGLLKALIQCRDEIDEYVKNEYPMDHPVHERYRQRDLAANPARMTLEEALSNE